MIDATLTKRQDGKLICAVGAMEIIAKSGRDSGELVPGQNIKLAVRPEKLQISNPGQGNIDAIVTDSMYIGTDRFVTAKCTNDIILEVRLQNSNFQRTPPTAGDHIGLIIPADAAVLLND